MLLLVLCTVRLAKVLGGCTLHLPSRLPWPTFALSCFLLSHSLFLSPSIYLPLSLSLPTATPLHATPRNARVSVLSRFRRPPVYQTKIFFRGLSISSPVWLAFSLLPTASSHPRPRPRKKKEATLQTANQTQNRPSRSRARFSSTSSSATSITLHRGALFSLPSPSLPPGLGLPAASRSAAALGTFFR